MVGRRNPIDVPRGTPEGPWHGGGCVTAVSVPTGMKAANRERQISLAVPSRGGDDAAVSTAETQLVPPTADVRESFVEAVSEFRAEGRNERTLVDQEFDQVGEGWETPEGFARLVAAIRAEALEDAPRPPGRVPQTTLWWTRGDQYYGRLDIRHRLTPELLEVGGHIGYAVRPGARRQGHATAMLRAALPLARELGITRALITCDATNEASRRVIEHNGGVLEDQRGVKLRFWVTPPPRAL